VPARFRGAAAKIAAVSVTEAPELEPGLVMGRYRLGRRLGAGGFGTVHEATDVMLDRSVAVKVIPSGSETPARARREAVAAARLEHPGIVAVYDAGEEDGARYLVSELVKGRTLAQLEQAGELTARDVLRAGLALADALAHAHECGVVHRDVKPQNVLVPDRPRSWRGAAKLADFGVAMLAGDDPLTRTGDVVGTLAYMAPEQAAGRRVDERADLYALALVLYEALAGVNPVRGASPAETARRLGQAVPSLGRCRPDLPAGLVAAVDTALRTAPTERATLDDLADALEEALVAVDDDGGVVPRHPVERTSGLPRGTARAAHALGAALLAGGALGWLGPSAQIPWAPAAALAAALALLLPRAGWLLAALGTVAALVAGPAVVDVGGVAAAGTALAVLAAVLPVPLLLARAPARAWSLPVLAPALGLASLAGAFPALAGCARRATHRAALGALGAWWLLLAEPPANRVLLLGAPAGAPQGAPAREAVSVAADALATTVASGAATLLAVWAAAALVLPWLVRGRFLAVDLVGATAWAAALAAATGTVAAWVGTPEPRGLVAAAIAAAAIAVATPRYSSRDDDAVE